MIEENQYLDKKTGQMKQLKTKRIRLDSTMGVGEVVTIQILEPIFENTGFSQGQSFVSYTAKVMYRGGLAYARLSKFAAQDIKKYLYLNQEFNVIRQMQPSGKAYTIAKPVRQDIQIAPQQPQQHYQMSQYQQPMPQMQQQPQYRPLQQPLRSLPVSQQQMPMMPPEQPKMVLNTEDAISPSVSDATPYEMEYIQTFMSQVKPDRWTEDYFLNIAKRSNINIGETRLVFLFMTYVKPSVA